MKFTQTVQMLANEFDQTDIHRSVIAEIESQLVLFRTEMRNAKNVETLLFLRRFMWDNLFAPHVGIYYESCKQNSMLKAMRIAADIRYYELLEQKRRNETEQISYVVVNTNKTVLTSVVDEVEELDGELIENEINYYS
jgi:hypothetical protein